MSDLTGKKFNRLTCLGRDPESKPKVPKWIFRCDCGTVKSIQPAAVTRGMTQSCGCLNREIVTKHGQGAPGKRTKTYMAWGSMLSRCNNPDHASFDDYGGRGITVCPEWHEFERFLSDMGEVPKGLSLDRIDNSLGYFKANCRWATHQEQMRNRRNTHFITFNGETRCVEDWAGVTGLGSHTLHSRLSRGWSIERALTQPKRSM